MIVVSKMGILAQSDNISNTTLSKSKFPDYARDYRNEYLFIRGINKTCGEFIKKLNEEGNTYSSSQANKLMLYINKFLKAQQLEYLNDTNKINIKDDDYNNIKKLDIDVENDFLGFKKFYECFGKLYGKLNIEYLDDRDDSDDSDDSDVEYKIKWSDSDSDSD